MVDVVTDMAGSAGTTAAVVLVLGADAAPEDEGGAGRNVEQAP